MLTSPYKLRWNLEGTVLREYLRFSLPLLGASLSGLVVAQGSIVASSATLGIAGAGVIALASTVVQFADRVDVIVTGTLYPAICRVADRTDVLFESFVKSNRLALMWAMPFGVGLALFADDLVRFGIGEKWRDAVPLLQAFGLIVAANHLGFNWTAYFRARADTRPIAVTSAWSVVAFVGLTLPALVFGGLEGFALGMAGMVAVQLACRTYYLRRLFAGFRLLPHAVRAVTPVVPGAAAVLLVRAVADGRASAPRGRGGARALRPRGAGGHAARRARAARRGARLPPPPGARRSRLTTLPRVLPAALARINALPDDALVLDVGAWGAPLHRADHVLDIRPYATRGVLGSFGPGPGALHGGDLAPRRRLRPGPVAVRGRHLRLRGLRHDPRGHPGPDRRLPRALPRGEGGLRGGPDGRGRARLQRRGDRAVPRPRAPPLVLRSRRRADRPARACVFWHKSHMVHSDWRIRVLPRWHRTMDLDDVLFGVFWEGELPAREKFELGPDLDALADRVRAKFAPSPTELRLKEAREQAKHLRAKALTPAREGAGRLLDRLRA